MQSDRKQQSTGLNYRIGLTILLVSTASLLTFIISLSLSNRAQLDCRQSQRQGMERDCDRSALYPRRLALRLFVRALVLSIADLLSRLGSVELPVGAVTSLLGSPLFVWFLYRRSLQ